MGQAGIPIAMIGSSLLGGAMAPTGQQMQSNEGLEGIDPRLMLGEGKGLISDMLSSLMDRAAAPVTMKTTVNPLPSFVGGSLPMPIAAPGMDANRMNPDLRTTPGFNVGRRQLTEYTGDRRTYSTGAASNPDGSTPPRTAHDQPASGGNGTAGSGPRPPSQSPAPAPRPPTATGGNNAPRSLSATRVPGMEQGDPLAAIQLLLGGSRG